MKKIMMFLMVAVLMLGISGNAMAYFEEYQLVRVAYNNTALGAGNEFISSLGDISTITSFSNTANNITLASVGATDWSQVNVAYFAVSFTGESGNGAAYSTGPAGGITNSGNFWGTMAGATGVSLDTWKNWAGSPSSITAPQASLTSYWVNSNNNGTSQGTFFGYLNNTAETNLGNLATAGYVDQVLYYFGSDPNAAGPGTAVATIRTLADGSMTLTPSAVPVPAAVYLFGTGLMGLVGLRRRMTA